MKMKTYDIYCRNSIILFCLKHNINDTFSKVAFRIISIAKGVIIKAKTFSILRIKLQKEHVSKFRRIR